MYKYVYRFKVTYTYIHWYYLYIRLFNIVYGSRNCKLTLINKLYSDSWNTKLEYANFVLLYCCSVHT